MKPYRLFRHMTLVSLLAALAGCGGGGGGGNPGAGAPSYPSSGAYGWVLKATGTTDALKYGLSFVHPSKPDTEYVIEVARDVVSDVRVVSSGTIDAAQLRATGNQAHSLVYIVARNRPRPAPSSSKPTTMPRRRIRAISSPRPGLTVNAAAARTRVQTTAAPKYA
jgi:hypothetical protein